MRVEIRRAVISLEIQHSNYCLEFDIKHKYLKKKVTQFVVLDYESGHKATVKKLQSFLLLEIIIIGTPVYH